MLCVVQTNRSAIKPVTLPQKGEVWLNVESGFLYEMRERPSAELWRSCHRVGAPETNYGCDPTVFCACWDDAVREGKWIKVMNCPPVEPPEPPVKGALFVFQQDAREFVKMAIGALKESGWTCLDLDAYKDDAEHPWKENVLKELWRPPTQGPEQYARGVFAIDEAYSEWARVQFLNLLRQS